MDISFKGIENLSGLAALETKSKHPVIIHRIVFKPTKYGLVNDLEMLKPYMEKYKSNNPNSSHIRFDIYTNINSEETGYYLKNLDKQIPSGDSFKFNEHEILPDKDIKLFQIINDVARRILNKKETFTQSNEINELEDCMKNTIYGIQPRVKQKVYPIGSLDKIAEKITIGINKSMERFFKV